MDSLAVEIMKDHALEFLRTAESWPEWSLDENTADGKWNHKAKFKALIVPLLYHLIEQSVALGGTVLDEFWERVSNCDLTVRMNVQTLCGGYTKGQTVARLYAGVNREDIELEPVFEMATELLSHLLVGFLNPRGSRLESDSPDSVSDIELMKTEELVPFADAQNRVRRKREALKRLASKRDGGICSLTGCYLRERTTEDDGVLPVLGHIIPNAFHGNDNALKYLAMFAGENAVKLVTEHSNSIKNVMYTQSDVYGDYNRLLWGIEARVEDGVVKYIYRRVPSSPSPGPGWITLKDGEEIEFGCGEDGKKLGGGPLPLLCNIQLAIARVVRMSGTANFILQLQEDVLDLDSESSLWCIASEHDYSNLDAKLFLHTICPSS